jgi:hypothetical protein
MQSASVLTTAGSGSGQISGQSASPRSRIGKRCVRRYVEDFAEVTAFLAWSIS